MVGRAPPPRIRRIGVGWVSLDNDMCNAFARKDSGTTPPENFVERMAWDEAGPKAFGPRAMAGLVWITSLPRGREPNNIAGVTCDA